MVAVVGETEAQIVKGRLQSAYEAYGVSITGIEMDYNSKSVVQIKRKYAAAANALALAVDGVYKEGSKEYNAALSLANALIDQLATEFKSVTKNHSILM